MHKSNYFKPIKKQFYRRDTVNVAKELLGKIIVKTEKNKILSGIIVETEAYTGGNDPASHSYNGLTKRNRVMFEDGGKIYVYFVYGNHFCFNIVTENKGTGSAVLIRAVEPLEGIDIMQKRRPKAKDIYNLTNGPGKFCSAFGINRKYNGLDISGGKIFLTYGENKSGILASPRIGIGKGTSLKYRFFLADNLFVSKHLYNKKATLLQKGMI
jgi:DNA-3-methyladenine glycosylase